MEEKKYSAAEMERILKIQEVIAKAMAGKLTWWQAAEIMGVADRTMRRWRALIEKNVQQPLRSAEASESETNSG